MTRIERTRAWLKRNKIFFEVFSLAILGFMGVVVSIASLQVSRIQTSLQRAQVSPAIVIQDKMAYNEAKGNYADEVVTVENNGYPLSEFSSEIISIFEVTRGASNHPGTAYFPIVYLCCQELTQGPTGRLTMYRQPGNNEDSARLDKELSSINAHSAEGQFSFRLINLLTVTYKDALGGRHSRRYLVWPIRGGQEIDESEAQTWLKRYKDGAAQLRDIAKLKGTELVDGLK
jgi:hypothetical protein